MAFGDDEERPLYRLVQGVADVVVASRRHGRAGLDPGVVARAASLVGAEASRLEELLGQLETAHLALEQERESLEAQSEALEQEVIRYTELEQQYGATKKEAMKQARREAEDLLAGARSEIERLVREIREGEASREVIRRTRERLRTLADEVKEEPATGPAAARRPATSVAPGDRVSLSPSGGATGTVLAVEKGSATVEINGKRIKLGVDGLYVVGNEADSQREGAAHSVEVEPLTSVSLNVRGHDREEALEAVHRFLDRAVLNGVNEVMIVHGVGEGVLVRAIQAALQSDVRVGSFRPGQAVEGGAGVTYVTLA